MDNIEFTYTFLEKLYTKIINSNYQVTNYINADDYQKSIIIRHDIDLSLEKALELARFENKLNIKSSYFLLLSTSFYNLFTKKSKEIVEEIIGLGHDVGIHFDETQYSISCASDYSKYINYEKDIFKQLFDIDANVVAMHRPSKFILENNLEFESIINTYSKKFFKEYAYYSDSRMQYKVDIIDKITSEEDDKIQLLIHPIWYNDDNQKPYNIFDKLIKKSKDNMVENFKLNIKDFTSFIEEK